MGQVDSSPEGLASEEIPSIFSIYSGRKNNSLSTTKLPSRPRQDFEKDFPKGSVNDFDIENEEGQERLKKLIENVPAEYKDVNYSLVQFICAAALRFRAGDMKKAMDRVLNYLEWRCLYLGSLAPNEIDKDIAYVLESGLFTLIDDCDEQGRACIVGKIGVKVTFAKNITALSK